MLRKSSIFLTLIALLVVAVVPTVFAADGIPREDLPNVVEIAQSDDNFSTLVSAVVDAGLATTLSGDGPFTVFAPTDAAFAKLPRGLLASLTPEQLQTVLTYHVVSGDVGSDIAKTLRSATTVSGETVQIKVFDGDIYLDDDSKVTTADILASNGKIHVIDTVLIPPSLRAPASEVASTVSGSTDATGSTIVDVAVSDPNFSTLVTALSAAGLVDTLKGEGPFTVFAPTDAAFSKLPEGTIPTLLANQALLTDVLTYHVANGQVGSDIAKSINSATMLNNETIDIKVFDGDIFINGDSKVTTADIVTSNGVIHVIDTVLLPSALSSSADTTTDSAEAAAVDTTSLTIAEVAAADPNFSTLVTALSAAGLVDALNGDGPFTVFAPTNDAFAKLPPGTIPALLANTSALTDVLTYHVISGAEVGSDIAKTVNSATMLNNDAIDIKVFDGDIYINGDSKVTTADIVTKNGVIHVIDTVLLPPADEE